MRVYFLSYAPAALKLNGMYLGTVDGFERHVSLDPADGVLAEIVPYDNFQPLNFRLNTDFFAAPPSFADVYLTEGDAIIYIREFEPKNAKLDVIYQTRFAGNLVTVFSQGRIYLSVEGTEYSLNALPQSFSPVSAEEKTLAGYKVLALYGGGMMIIISESGKIIYMNSAENVGFNGGLSVTVNFETCTAAKAECYFAYDGEKLELVSSRTIEMRPPEKNILHFAFFESVLTRGDYGKYLDESLLPKADALKNYLGNFVGVTVPTESFYSAHGDIAAAGLVYPHSKNLFEVKYFAVDFNGEKISNIYPVE